MKNFLQKNTFGMTHFKNVIKCITTYYIDRKMVAQLKKVTGEI